MEIKKEILPKSQVRLTIKVSSPEMRGFFARAYNKLASNIEVKGFRKGMAPKSLVISAIGESRLNSEILDLALKETYSEALKKEKILPIAPPQVSIKILKDLTVDTAELEYAAEIDILPEVKIGDYKKIKVPTSLKLHGTSKIEVSDDEVNQVLSHLQRQKATFREILRPIKTGDRVEINFSGFERGVKIENLSSQHYPVILGSGTLIPDFEKKLFGLKKDDKKEFKVELVDPKNPKLPKKPVDFKVEVLATQEVMLPKLDDAFAGTFQKKAMTDLKKALADDIVLQKKAARKKEIENQILEELLKITTVEVPESLVSQEVDRQLNDIRLKIEKMGMTLEKYLENLKKSEAEFRNALEPQAERIIKIGLALGEVTRRESASWRIDPKDKNAGKIAIDKLIENSIK